MQTAVLGPYERGLYYFVQTRFELTRGKDYRAYGLLMEKGGLVRQSPVGF